MIQKKAKERSSSAINFIHSLKNPKSQYEQEEEKQKKEAQAFKGKKGSIRDRIKKKFSIIVDTFSSTKKSDNQENPNIKL